MFLYNTARKINSHIKQYKKRQNGKFLSPCRRIEFVYPPSEGKFVAMTFDDGPTTLPTTSNSDKGLTESLLDTLAEFGAKGTFDVIGTTAKNYPDTEGIIGDFSWSGIHFDHYPKFGEDLNAGAVNQSELIRRIISDGNEITSHTYSHTLFGPMRAIYGQRVHFNTLSDVVEDLKKLHNYMEDSFGYRMTLSRPPHYIDTIPDSSTSYDAYRIMGYNYLAASFDGAGWQPLENYEKVVSAMIELLKLALDADPDCLNGKVIFQKDGCNMNLRTPVTDALPKQLEILRDYGYKVITASQLIELSAFEDFSPSDPRYAYAKDLLAQNKVIGYKNNSFMPERFITKDEFNIMCSPCEIFKVERKLTYADMTQLANDFALSSGIDVYSDKKIGNAMLNIALKHGLNIDDKNLKDNKYVKRADSLELLCALCKKEFI